MLLPHLRNDLAVAMMGRSTTMRIRRGRILRNIREIAENEIESTIFDRGSSL